MKITGFYMTLKDVNDLVEMYQYVRDDNSNPIGVVIIDKQGRIGWSLYNKEHEEETATTDKGILIALSRAKTVFDLEVDLWNRVAKASDYKTSDEITRLIKVITIIRNIEQHVKGNSVKKTVS